VGSVGEKSLPQANRNLGGEELWNLVEEKERK
jgi:hypothetical protein